jgi:serine/threonine protein kinase
MPETKDTVSPPRQVGRYVLFGEIASGGMAAVHFGLLNGPVGFRRTVAIKRLHEAFSRDPAFVSQFLDEARLAARIRHPNVVQTLDVVTASRELLLVMEYVDGETLADLRRLREERGVSFPIDIAVGIIAGALHGLDAAHGAKDENGLPLNIVHRDVSPQNIILGRDGVPRVLDFGVAKAAARYRSTQGEVMKGKLRYMAPEQVTAKGVDRRTDVFAAGIVLWETLTGRTLFEVPEGGAAAVINRVINAPIVPPSTYRPDVARELDGIVMKALQRPPENRFQTGLEFAEALEDTLRIPTARAMGRWVVAVAGDVLDQRAEQIAEIEARAGSADLETISDEMLSSLSGQIVRKSLPPGPDDRTVADTPAETRRAGPTEVTHVTATPESEPTRSRRRLVLVWLLWPSSMRDTGPELAGEPGSGAPPGSGSALVRPAVASAPVVEVAAPGAAGAGSQVGHPQAPRPPGPPPRWVPKRKPKPDCSNPTYVNEEGIKVFRKECL